MTCAAQFSPHDGPDRLQSKNWIDDYNETMTLGALNSTVRTSDQTEIGLFWTEQTNQQYVRAFRGLGKQERLDTADNARLMAMLTAGTRWDTVEESSIVAGEIALRESEKPPLSVDSELGRAAIKRIMRRCQVSEQAARSGIMKFNNSIRIGL